MGPMQFLPGTWSRYASDGDGDGKADVQNVFDSTLAAARYLCSGGLNLRDQSQVMAAILRYNNSVAYARNVLGWAAAYATGVVPVDLPPITGPIPPIGDMHLDNYQGLGPGPAAERARPARRRPAGADAADGAQRRRQPDPRPTQVRRSGPLPGPAPGVVPQDAAAGAAGAAAVAAAVDAAASAAAAAAAECAVFCIHDSARGACTGSCRRGTAAGRSRSCRPPAPPAGPLPPAPHRRHRRRRLPGRRPRLPGPAPRPAARAAPA